MRNRAARRWTLASCVPSHAFAPRARGVLKGLGYRIAPISTQGRFSDDRWEPDLRIVDERYLEKLPDENYLPRTPVIVLTGSRPRAVQDARVIGCVELPAAVSALFPLPLGRMVSTRARVLRQHGEQVAMAFSRPPAQSTRAITEYVESRLAVL